jgi:DNA-binding LytR/AlgR family response regulator
MKDAKRQATRLANSDRRSRKLVGTAACKARFRIRREPLSTRPILIVDDEYFIAADLESQIRDDGEYAARIALSVSQADEALRHAGDFGGAILDVNVGGIPSFGLADGMMKTGLPFVFFSGYDSVAIPDRFLGIPRVSKPAGWGELKGALRIAQQHFLSLGMGTFRDSVEAALPALRDQARRLTGSNEEADRLVEQTLERAISAVGERSLRVSIEEWLMVLLDHARQEARSSVLH